MRNRIQRICAVTSLALGLMFVLATRPAGNVELIYRGQTGRDSVAFEFRNGTRRSISYNGTVGAPEIHWMALTPQGWKRQETVYVGPDFPQPRTLASSERVVFELHSGRTPCKIAIVYSDDRSTNGVWRLLPRWIASGLPWLKPNRALEGPVFNLEG